MVIDITNRRLSIDKPLVIANNLRLFVLKPDVDVEAEAEAHEEAKAEAEPIHF